MNKIIVFASFLLFNFMLSSAFAQSKPEEGWINWTNFKKYVNQNKEVKESEMTFECAPAQPKVIAGDNSDAE